jgi:hypothetical protein
MSDENPRQGEKISWRDPEALISGAVILLFAIGYVLTYFKAPPEGSEQAVGQMQGALLGGLAAVISYWIGSSRGSRRNADRADRAIDVAKAATEDGEKK